MAASVSWGIFLIYSACFLSSEGRWWLPLPIYMEHALWPLFATAAIAGYSYVARKAWLSSPVARRSLVARAWTTILVAVVLASSTFVMAWNAGTRTGMLISDTF